MHRTALFASFAPLALAARRDAAWPRPPEPLDALALLAALSGGLVYALLPAARAGSTLFGAGWLFWLALPGVWLGLRFWLYLRSRTPRRVATTRPATLAAVPRRRPHRPAVTRRRPRARALRRRLLAMLLPGWN